MTGNERLRLVRTKLERARKHISELDLEVETFLKSRPYEVSSKRDLHTREVVYHAARVEPVPPSIPIIAADALQNLRTALDHLACDLVEIAGNAATRNTGFPVFASLGIYKAQATEKTRGMRMDAIEAIDSIKPYRGGNDALWILQSLNNVNKHRLLNIVGLAYRFQAVTPNVLEYLRKAWSGRFGAWPSPEDASPDLIEYERRHFPLIKGDVLFIDLPDAEVNHQSNFSFGITITEAKLTNGSPILETFKDMTEVVENVISRLERKFT